ncbi:MAG: DUF4838 domain-containing protein [Deltaproteobacteria bacterium]|nr:DUF4838 domain-containing protein [Deltaproteobacteria bacterium]
MTALSAISFLLTCVSVAAGPGGVDLAELDGWEIVVAPDAIASEVYAAEEFRDHLTKAGGPMLAIVRTTAKNDQHVYIGSGEDMRRSPAGFDTDRFESDDFRIIVRNGHIAIAGGRPRGTLYGVYTFLEDYLGVRFVTADFTHIPELKQHRMVGPIDRFYHPPLVWRWADFKTNYRRPDFAARLRLNGDAVSTPRSNRVRPMPVGSTDWSIVGRYGGRSSTELVLHTLQDLIPPSEYAEKHPEYYQLWKGEKLVEKRYSDGRFVEGLQPCLSHPDVRRIVTENALSRLAARPDLKNVNVGQNDSNRYCDCPRCSAIDDPEGSPAGSMLAIVNVVADEVSQKFPDRLVATFAYAWSQEPPKHLRPRENVLIWFCQNQCFIHSLDDSSCERNAVQHDRMKRWSDMTDQLYVWAYYMNHDRRGFQLPLPNLQWIERDVRTWAGLGVQGVFAQAFSSSHGNEFEELRNYILSRMMWDPSQDAQQLMDEWLGLYYGRAAPPIRRWLRRLHDRVLASGRHRHCLGGRYDEYGLDESDVRFGLDTVEEAMRLADSNETRTRVERASIWAYRAALEPAWYVTADKHVPPVVAKKVRPAAIRFFELCEKHGVHRTASGGYFEMEKEEKRLKDHLGTW